MQASLDYDALFAKSLQKRPVVLGYYFTGDTDSKGILPAPVMQKEDLQGKPIRFISWNGYGSNIEQIARQAPMAYSWVVCLTPPAPFSPQPACSLEIGSGARR